MKHALMVMALGSALTASPSLASYTADRIEGECLALAEPGSVSCTCRGHYFESRLGRDEGLVALHLASRSYAPQTPDGLLSLYERFGRTTLDKVALRIMETRGEVALYCPLSANLDD